MHTVLRDKIGNRDLTKQFNAFLIQSRYSLQLHSEIRKCSICNLCNQILNFGRAPSDEESFEDFAELPRTGENCLHLLLAFVKSNIFTYIILYIAAEEEEDEGDGVMERLAREVRDRLLHSLREQQQAQGGVDMGSGVGRTGASGGSSAALSADQSSAMGGAGRRRGCSILPPEMGREGEASIARANLSGLLGDVSRIVLYALIT